MDNDSDKRDLIQESIHRVRWKMAGWMTLAIGCALAVVLLVVISNPQHFSPLKYAKDELRKLSEQNMKPETRSKIAKALFFAGDFQGAGDVIGKIENDWDKDVARSEIVRLASSYPDDSIHKKKAKDLKDTIQAKREREFAKLLLEESNIDRGYAIEHPSAHQQSKSLLDQITEEVGDAAPESKSIKKLDVMAAFVQVAAHHAENSNSVLPGKKVQAVLKEMEQQLEIINNIPMDFRIFQGRRSAAEIAAYLKDDERAFKILDEARKSTGEISAVHERTLAMRSIAIAAAHFALLKLHDCRKSTCADKLLELAIEAKNAITEDGEKYAPLSSIVEAQVARAGISDYPREDLKKARDMAKEIYSKAHLSSALRLLVTEMVKLGYEREAVAIAEPNDTDVKVDLLATILLTSTVKTDPLRGKNYGSPRLPQDERDGMVKINAGPFTMGIMKGERNETPEHTVYVDEFWLDRSETTVEMYKRFLDDTNRQPNGEYWNWKGKIPEDDLEKPVIGVTWGEANAYCRWRQKRLPTEAEWEKAARGTGKRKYPWGPTRRKSEKDKEPANYDKDDPKGDYYSVLTKVGSFKEQNGDTPEGIHDMAGNAWEWVEDWYDGSAYVDIHSVGYPASSIGDMKILRGGSWDNTDKDDRLRSTFRLVRDPKDSYGTYGFRCAQSIDAPLHDDTQLPPKR